MMRNDVIATSFFAATLAVVIAAFSVHDRNATLQFAQDRAFSVARMMAAHAEAAIEHAAARVEELAPLVADWDLQDDAAARAIFEGLQNATSSQMIDVMSVVDVNGTSLVNSLAYPSDQIDVSDRPFFSAHAAGDDGPLILGDDRPGTITGQNRFTYTQALRNNAGEIHAIIVVIIFNRVFEGLYAEVASWPSARASLYNEQGEVLAGMQRDEPGTSAYNADVLEYARDRQSGTAIVDDGDQRRLVAWNRIDRPVVVIAKTSQVIGQALADWRTRSVALALGGIALTAIFAALLRSLRRARQAADSAEFYRTSVSEVHHRVKNALQLSISMMNIRSRTQTDPEMKALLTKLGGQLAAIAAIQDLLQHDVSLDEVDLVDLMDRLCGHLRKAGTGRTITFQSRSDYCKMETNRATYAAIIMNELLTNAMKHARRSIVLRLECNPDDVLAIVSDDGRGLPDGFLPEDQDGFGLRAIALIAERIGGTITMENGADGGVFAHFLLPLKE